MIFVTVGTHEQQFDRLLIELDRLIEDGSINESVFIQSGYSNYKLRNSEHESMLPFDKMQDMVAEARIVITHGGPGSIFLPLSNGKIPVVVPRNPNYNEHVDMHQIEFVKKLSDANKILAVFNIEDLASTILNYDEKTSEIVISETADKESFNKSLSSYLNSIIDL